MKTFNLVAVFMITLFSVLPLSADELSAEEYLKEINRASSRVYEQTNGKTLSAKIEILEALLLEYEDNHPVLDFLLQELGTAYSFTGQHQQALYAFDQHDPYSDQLNTAVKALKTQDAVKNIADTAGKYQIVMVNEAHHVPQHRILTYRLLESLWNQGFRYLALEALSANAENKLPPEYVNEKSGFYTNEPLFSNLVLRARQLGFQLVSYDYGSEVGAGTEARERSAVKNLRTKVFNSEPDAKMLIHVGYSHINESRWLAHYLKESLKTDPLTINQTDFTERSDVKYEPKSYTWVIDKHDFSNPVVLTKGNGEYWSPTPEEYDVTVIWPRTEYRLNRPQWARLGKELMPVDPSWCKQFFPCTIEAYKVGNSDEVPSDRIVIHDTSVPSGIFISESTRILKVTDAQGKLKHIKEFRID